MPTRCPTFAAFQTPDVGPFGVAHFQEQGWYVLSGFTRQCMGAKVLFSTACMRGEQHADLAHGRTWRHISATEGSITQHARGVKNFLTQGRKGGAPWKGWRRACRLSFGSILGV